MLRATDGSTDPRAPGQSFHTPSSAEQNSWDASGTHFYVVAGGGGRLQLLDFDPNTLKIQRRDTPALEEWGREPQFSFSRPNILYGIQARDRRFEQFDLTSGKISLVHDSSSCLKLGFTDHGSSISVSADDRRFMSVFGPQQDRNYIVYVYDRDKGCRWYNTMTGEIGGQWGPKGNVSFDVRFGVHDARIAKSGDFVLISGSKEGPLFWDVDTLTATLCPMHRPTSCGGHHVMGYSHLINLSGQHPMDLRLRSLNHLDTSTPLVDNLEPTQGWYDKHPSWNDVNADDTMPACLATYRPDNPPGGPPTVKGPWENEVDCVETDGKASRVWRFAHTYSTAQNGFWSSPRGNVSQDGRFYAFTSDWEDQLGQSTNGPAKQKYRTDVFIVELK